MRMGMETRAGNGDSDKVGDKNGNADRHEVRDRDEVGDRDGEEDRDNHEIGSGEMLLIQPQAGTGSWGALGHRVSRVPLPSHPQALPCTETGQHQPALCGG